MLRNLVVPVALNRIRSILRGELRPTSGDQAKGCFDSLSVDLLTLLETWQRVGDCSPSPIEGADCLRYFLEPIVSLLFGDAKVVAIGLKQCAYGRYRLLVKLGRRARKIRQRQPNKGRPRTSLSDLGQVGEEAINRLQQGKACPIGTGARLNVLLIRRG